MVVADEADKVTAELEAAALELGMAEEDVEEEEEEEDEEEEEEDDEVAAALEVVGSGVQAGAVDVVFFVVVGSGGGVQTSVVRVDVDVVLGFSSS